MKRCPITYEPVESSPYSEKGLKMLSSSLSKLELFSYTAEEQRAEARMLATKISIQGVQPKLSAILNIKDARFEIVESGGKFILKPQHQHYSQLPENEDVTMRMASMAGLEVPLHGMIWSKDHSLTYFIKRFDRVGHKDKIPVEDFAQLAGMTRETKYNYSMEKVIMLVEKFCTFPVIEKAKLFRLVIFNYLTGNEDMHLKNYSLIRKQNKIELSPCYDLLNTTIVVKGKAEEIALPIAGKKSNLNRKLLVEYFGIERCGLTLKVVESILQDLYADNNAWFQLIKDCFLSQDFKEKYSDILHKRLKLIAL